MFGFKRRYKKYQHPLLSSKSKLSKSDQDIQFIDTISKADKRSFNAFMIIAIALGVLFASYWFRPSNIAQNFSGPLHIFDFVLFAIITFVVWHQLMMDTLTWLISRAIKRPKYEKPQPGHKVAFITTFVPSSEPLELLDRILPAMVNADYQHDTWLLDEGGSEEARQLCEKYGVRYFTRHGVEKCNQPQGHIFAAKTKGGNHNAWYDSYGHAYDFVAQIDTDFKPKKKFLMRTLGYFRDPSVAFVGTPQIYGNEHESFVAKGASEQGYSFYGPILRGLSGRSSTMMLGANHVVRVAALKKIGYYRAHLTEDLLTGMTIHSKRYKSIYVAEDLAVGEGPSNWQAYFNQQMRWAHGNFDILLRHTEKLISKMKFRQAVYYFIMQQHYFSGFAMALGILMLSLYFVLGIQVIQISPLVFAATYIPLTLWNFSLSYWLQRYNVRPRKEKGLLLYGRAVSLAAQPVYMMAFLGALAGKKLTFKVTPKGDAGQVETTPFRLFVPHFLLGSITLADLMVGLAEDRTSTVLVFWAALNTLIMYGICFWAVVPGYVRAFLSTRHLEQKPLQA